MRIAQSDVGFRSTTINAKTAVMFEMAVLWTGTLLSYHQFNPRVSLPDLIIFIGLPAGLVILILAAILTAFIDIFGSDWPALFGLLIAGSALLYQGIVVSNAIDTLLDELVSFQRIPEDL